MKNTAAAPYQDGDAQNLVPQFTGQIMKLIVPTSVDEKDSTANSEKTVPIANQESKISKKNIQINDIEVENYPAFPEGIKHYFTMF